MAPDLVEFWFFFSRFSGYTIHRCGLGCRAQLHYHCIYCESMLLRKEDFERHLIVCKAKQSTTTPLAEPCAPSGEPCAPGEPADLKIHSLTRRVCPRPIVREKCPMCNVLMNKRNIRKHFERKHPNQQLSDISSKCHLRSKCIDVIPLHIQNKTWDENRHGNMDLPWRTGKRSYRRVHSRSVTYCTNSAKSDPSGRFTAKVCADYMVQGR